MHSKEQPRPNWPGLLCLLTIRRAELSGAEVDATSVVGRVAKERVDDRKGIAIDDIDAWGRTWAGANCQVGDTIAVVIGDGNFGRTLEAREDRQAVELGAGWAEQVDGGLHVATGADSNLVSGRT